MVSGGVCGVRWSVTENEIACTLPENKYDVLQVVLFHVVLTESSMHPGTPCLQREVPHSSTFRDKGDST